MDAVKFFELGLEINALHLGAWFSCGCAAMAAGEYQKAARCFQRCVSIDSDVSTLAACRIADVVLQEHNMGGNLVMHVLQNFEAWNNMAAAYVRSHQK